MQVYVVVDDKPQVLPKEDYGHFFSDELYIIDLKGKKHRYVLMWMGPKLNSLEVTTTSKHMDLITNYENSSFITR